MKVLICGDYIVDGRKSFDTQIFGDLLPLIRKSDISIYNQEHPVTLSDEIYRTKMFGPKDYCPPSAVRPIINAGFTHVSLANNHIFNRGYSGLNDTISFFKDNGITPFGAGLTLNEAKEPLIISKDGYILTFLNFAENEFNTATSKHGGANPLDIIDNVRQIKEAKENSDFVFVIIHGGIEYLSYPSSRMVKQYRFYADNGASAIVSHHTHVVSGYEIYNQIPIFYGIGNFIPTKHLSSIFKKEITRYSYPVLFTIENNKLSFEGLPMIFEKNTQQLKFLTGEREKNFYEYQKKINHSINSFASLEKKILSDLLDIEKKAYYYTLFTRSNYFIFKVFRKLGLLKVYLKFVKNKMSLNKKNSALWNLIRCESHRDVLNAIYNEFFDTYQNP